MNQPRISQFQIIKGVVLVGAECSRTQILTPSQIANCVASDASQNGDVEVLYRVHILGGAAGPSSGFATVAKETSTKLKN